eukprot:TRINITY_DN4073_c0_g1_i1.p1 TRINITY_DN4073_c0_g1~~TRINITY_DN4073_c0_g1_i1.p1  ORF type:complete len:322 (+),score=92.03 TRINITY_DN4073_c0_g1_i1:90-1055(+)
MKCSVCQGEEFSSVEGSYFCKRCGSESQLIDEELDPVNVECSRSLRKIRIPQSATRTPMKTPSTVNSALRILWSPSNDDESNNHSQSTKKQRKTQNLQKDHHSFSLFRSTELPFSVAPSATTTVPTTSDLSTRTSRFEKKLRERAAVTASSSGFVPSSPSFSSPFSSFSSSRAPGQFSVPSLSFITTPTQQPPRPPPQKSSSPSSSSTPFLLPNFNNLVETLQYIIQLQINDVIQLVFRHHRPPSSQSGPSQKQSSFGAKTKNEDDGGGGSGEEEVEGVYFDKESSIEFSRIVRALWFGYCNQIVARKLIIEPLPPRPPSQ